MITENLQTLKINKLTQAQYNAALAAGNINENELYFVTDNDVYATKEYVESLAASIAEIKAYLNIE